MQTRNQIPYNEFLGKFVKINKSRNTRNSNRSGIVVNETKNMLFLINTGQQKRDEVSKKRNL